MSQRKALCVGINDYPYDGSDLNGCVNDARAWARLLIEHFDFDRNEVRLLLDDEAGREQVVDGLAWLLEGAAPGDMFVFSISAHGTYVVDESGDERERYDEALCPHDSQDHLIVDDELRTIFEKVPTESNLVVIADTCHSGTVTRSNPGMPTPDDRRVRFLNPSLRDAATLSRPWLAQTNHERIYDESAMKEVLLSGCAASEYSYDALIDGSYHGAMTYYALEIIREADYDLTYEELHDSLNHKLDDAGFPQHPRLEGPAHNKLRRAFR